MVDGIREEVADKQQIDPRAIDEESAFSDFHRQEKRANAINRATILVIWVATFLIAGTSVFVVFGMIAHYATAWSYLEQEPS